MIETTVNITDSTSLLSLFGPRDQHLKRIREALEVSVSTNDNCIHIRGDEAGVLKATHIFEQLKARLMRFGEVSVDDVSHLLGQTDEQDHPGDKPIAVMQVGRQVRPRTAGQIRYVESIDDNDLIFCVGPAGTGKTYLAVAKAVSALRENDVRKIVLVRPAVEAGESLGFLPGDLAAKINPYLRPLLDALREMMDYELVRRYMDEDTIEVVPLAYMRGRTLNESFIILDEAQNTTVSQMKMFLTRMGSGSKIVVSGDSSQVDLPQHARSGFTDAIERLRGIERCTTVKLTKADIVRHRLVQDIVRRYEEKPKHKG